MKLFFIISLLVLSVFAVLTACESEGNAANDSDPNDPNKLF